MPVPWAQRPLAQVMVTLIDDDGEPYYYEPRNVLRRVGQRLYDLGLTPVVAFELEFYLIDRERLPGGAPQPPISPATGRRDFGTQVYGMKTLDRSDEHTSELQSLMRISYAVFCLKKKKTSNTHI